MFRSLFHQNALILREYQSAAFTEMVQAVERCRGEMLTVLYPRQSGKNELAAAFVACLLAVHAKTGGTIIVCAPTYSPQAEISFERVRKAIGGVLICPRP